MKRWNWIAASLVLVSLASGCQNGGIANSCPNGLTIAPPSTYALQIPTTAQNQPYYNGAVGQPAGNVVDPNSQAPTPAAGQPGWRTPGNNSFSLGQPANTGQGTSVVESTTRSPFPQGSIDSRTSITSNGVSYLDSVNYRSTSVDESRDETRLPVTDASLVRAPTPYTPPAGANRIPQQQYANQGFVYGQQQPTIVPGTFVNVSQPRLINGRIEYYSQPTQVVATNNNFSVSPAAYGAPQGYQSAPQVLAQSTTSYDPTTTANFQNGWRDRDSTNTLR